jgi:hypothetical protein
MSEKKTTPIDAGDILRRVRALPTDEQTAIFDELQRQEIDRLTAGTDELLSSLPSYDELVGGLDLTPPTLDEVQKMLLKAIDSRIEACSKLREHLGAASNPVKKDRQREWRQRAKEDRTAEKQLRMCRDLYGMILEAELR